MDLQVNAELEDIKSATTETITAPVVEKWQEGVITYQNKKYLYNNQIKTYLFMGIDIEGPVLQAKDGISGGQSDANFLLVVDSKKEKITVIAIHRNTMTDVEIYDEAGNYVELGTRQICLQHGYGDGMRLSCIRSTEAVKSLFYNIPISGYLSLNMGGIRIMNDAIGGVSLTVIQDVDDLKAGETVTLNGDEAYRYLRSRDLNAFDSATDRLNRQMQYICAFLEQARAYTGGSTEKAMEIYEKMDPYLVSSIDFAMLLDQINTYHIRQENIVSLPGKTQMGEMFEEYILDDKAFYELVLDVFYEEVP